MPRKIRITIIEDNRLLCEDITALIKRHDDFRAIAVNSTPEDILQKIGKLKPDILLLDLGFAGRNSLQIVKSVMHSSLKTKVIVMDLIPTQAGVLEFIRAGVWGFILKDATLDDFLRTIRSVDRGVKVLPSVMTGSLFSQIVENSINSRGELSSKLIESVRVTTRERQVIEFVSEGMSNKEIAQKINLSPYTVKSHIHNILEKLALHSRVQIARYAQNSESFRDIASSISLINQ